MKREDIQSIISEGLFPGPKEDVSLVETHISWVVLTNAFAFKIKKPVRFDFLDFSTLAQRQHYCETELRLNRRLAPQLYLRVLPIGAGGIGSSEPPVRDYALQMRRMDNAREMDKLLPAQEVSKKDMAALAALLADFHQQHRLPTDWAYQPEKEAEDFAGLFAFEADLGQLQLPEPELLQKWQTAVPAFLNAHAPRSRERIRSGFWVEGHGDLHSRNIFLPEGQPPVVFDCLEFDESLRQMDVLNELAFLCMDLAYYGAEGLAQAFREAYAQRWPCFETPEDERLFTYYKAYRANVRLKVTLLELREQQSESSLATATAYWALLRQYCASCLPLPRS